MMKPGYLPVMFNKIIKRIREPKPALIKMQAEKWCQQHAVDTFEFIKSIDSELYEEAVQYNEYLKKHGQKVIDTIPVKMGGGGNCVLLYFLTRRLKPDVIVETGVAMGFSSHSFLSAIKKNEKGHLFSSDFPYFRLPNPEQYIGCVVEDQLKENWTLLIEGDQKNLQKINQQIGSLGLLHYDSDKSYSGRKEALTALNDKIDAHTTIVFDDIADNFHFRDWVTQTGRAFIVLSNPNGGYVGVTGKILEKA